MQAVPSVPSKGTLPVGVTPILLSSADNIALEDKRRGRSTVVRRKSVSGHVFIAEATKAPRDSMTEQLKGLTDVTYEAKQNKFNLQLKMFTE